MLERDRHVLYKSKNKVLEKIQGRFKFIHVSKVNVGWEHKVNAFICVEPVSVG